MAAYRYDNSINSAGLGTALQGVQIYVLTQPANTAVFPPVPLATIYTDATGLVPAANPVTSDGNGNFFFYAPSGIYTLFYFDPNGRIPNEVFPDQAVTTQGGGTVSSVALTAPPEFAVSGSPITTAGTIAISKVNQNANVVYAGPSSGGAASPGFRALVAGDLPAGQGSVTSVQLGVVTGTLFTSSITGTNPVTSSGTFTLHIDLVSQNPNTVLAGPASGVSPGPVTARALVAADVSGISAVAFSATPAFDASTFPNPTFTMTLTGNVTSSSVANATTGEHITFIITQNVTGGWTFAWPANFRGASDIGSTGGYVSVQEFVYDGSNWRATSNGVVTAS